MSIFKITKAFTNPTIRDPEDKTGIRCIVDTSTQNSVFTVEIEKAYHFKNNPNEEGIDSAAREYILKDLKKEIDKELEEKEHEDRSN